MWVNMVRKETSMSYGDMVRRKMLATVTGGMCRLMQQRKTGVT